MEALELLFLLLEGLLELIVASGLISDVFFWIKSSPSRKKRKTAKREGKEVPKRDRWNLAFTVCSTIVVFAVFLLVMRLAIKGH